MQRDVSEANQNARAQDLWSDIVAVILEPWYNNCNEAITDYSILLNEQMIREHEAGTWPDFLLSIAGSIIWAASCFVPGANVLGGMISAFAVSLTGIIVANIQNIPTVDINQTSIKDSFIQSARNSIDALYQAYSNSAFNSCVNVLNTDPNLSVFEACKWFLKANFKDNFYNENSLNSDMPPALIPAEIYNATKSNLDSLYREYERNLESLKVNLEYNHLFKQYPGLGTGYVYYDNNYEKLANIYAHFNNYRLSYYYSDRNFNGYCFHSKETYQSFLLLWINSCSSTLLAETLTTSNDGQPQDITEIQHEIAEERLLLIEEIVMSLKRSLYAAHSNNHEMRKNIFDYLKERYGRDPTEQEMYNRWWILHNDSMCYDYLIGTPLLPQDYLNTAKYLLSEIYGELDLLDRKVQELKSKKGL